MQDEKQELCKEFRHHDNDTGSAEVQITLFTHRINEILKHLKTHKKDTHTRHGLILLVGKRKRLLNYLYKKDPKSCEKLAKSLGIKIQKASS